MENRDAEVSAQVRIGLRQLELRVIPLDARARYSKRVDNDVLWGIPERVDVSDIKAGNHDENPMATAFGASLEVHDERPFLLPIVAALELTNGLGSNVIWQRSFESGNGLAEPINLKVCQRLVKQFLGGSTDFFSAAYGRKRPRPLVFP